MNARPLTPSQTDRALLNASSIRSRAAVGSLNPTREERHAALREMRAERLLAGKALKAEWLLEMLAEHPAAAPVDKRG